VVLLDTSGSMTDELARVLGAIGSFCEAAGVDSVRVVQCDSSITSDERVEPAILARFRILGYGGSDLRPAMQALAQDPDVEALVVITDGGITYPASAPPYHVLWALTEPFEGFQPGYGQVVCALSD
jgi:predicted metal-dependent peptidase